MPHLESLKVNKNSISTLIAIPSLKHYEALDNPIELIESTICNHGVRVLAFDWLAYMCPIVDISNSLEALTTKLS